jgi:hypothetical protein
MSRLSDISTLLSETGVTFPVRADQLQPLVLPQDSHT